MQTAQKPIHNGQYIDACALWKIRLGLPTNAIDYLQQPESVVIETCTANPGRNLSSVIARANDVQLTPVYPFVRLDPSV